MVGDDLAYVSDELGLVSDIEDYLMLWIVWGDL
jgi:hypothetical protein